MIGDGYRAKNSELGGNGIAFMRAGRLKPKGWDWSGIERFEECAVLKLQGKIALAGDTVITTKGNSLGRTGYVSDMDEGFVYSPHLSYWRPLDQAVLNRKFLRYWANGFELERQLQSFAYGTDMAPYLSLGSQRCLKITLPPLKEQAAIADVLGVLDDKITVNDRITKIIEQILVEKFEKIEFIGSDFGESVPVSTLVDFNPREPKPKSLSVPYIDMAALPTNSARISSIGEREPKSGAKFRNGDTLLARITPCLENGKTGYVDLLPEGEVGIGSTEFIVMRAKADVPKQLPYFIARNESFREHAIRNMEGTSGRQRVAAANISDFLVRSPDTTALKDFGDEAERGFRYMETLDKESRTLAELRDTLLPRLMSGEIRVKDAEEIVEDVT